ncbi:hypothetical protein MTO96_024605, partial [Rhipicephalus appendiculatus]
MPRSTTDNSPVTVVLERHVNARFYYIHYFSDLRMARDGQQRGWDDVSFHGSSQIPTSNLDALAADGVILNALYAMPACTPSRSALMSGRYPIRIAEVRRADSEARKAHPLMVGEPWGLPQDVPILPEYLKELGYETHLVGKWHLGAHKRNLTPTYRGFDSFYGFLYGEEDYYTHSVSY